ncbi:trehalose-6-phosphate synthase [Gluconacetobacter entanii]|uniref:Trehalose-6-phosphate synthase n=1 Tax=Gluconacetobacter entanii TaxID=108528 RepID=A0A318PUR4_9PROT|nr:trehalose-6-phosphate synthase [Gluconacetobacter entanii]MBE7620390.1 trehalose-6-phosphate synthase [Komagataeibacter sp. FXV2]MCE2578986.1 trehalose-6-phosphate synthase [Komagataeibacter sp. FNDCR1]MBY4640790.1 trehalose-6-phosphate synthase [Gluconacetobacter entanii]MCW4581185.1 trehalose-6-phosphate synthase [Gluconacetobacter entanii]MCW4584445.1 trehalose-6-phosphate synthase [Gluconacetobacter entanii]
MGRLIIVSNRVPAPRDRNQPAGGLAVGLKDALREGDALWFGWSGRQVDHMDGDPTPSIDQVKNVTYATIDLTRAQHAGFYQNFSNGILWPLFHYRVGLMNYSRMDWEMYLGVNAMFARTLRPLLRPDDTIWIHDYHLFPLGQALRDLGVKCRIGFFLHIPFPPWSLVRALPGAELLLEDMQSYDLVGVQTPEDAENLNHALRMNHMAERGQAFPIGIDPVEFRAQAEASMEGPEVSRLRDSLRGAQLVLGVDRLDYSKGLPERFKGYEALLSRYPEHRGRVTFLQVAPISRGNVEEYRQLRCQLDELTGRINGAYSEFDWTPIRYITRPISRDVLAGFYRMADVALITPLRDGMNLVAKEYVAAQDPADPGVLILSHFAGAAPELDEAILVNPYDTDEIADALHQALTMQRPERQTRWIALEKEVSRTTAVSWANDFLQALDGAPVSVSS